MASLRTAFASAASIPLLISLILVLIAALIIYSSPIVITCSCSFLVKANPPDSLFDIFISPIYRMYLDLREIPWITILYVVAALEISAFYTTATASIRDSVYGWLVPKFLAAIGRGEEAVPSTPASRERRRRRAERERKAKEYKEMTGLSPPPFAVSPDTPPTAASRPSLPARSKITSQIPSTSGNLMAAPPKNDTTSDSDFNVTGTPTTSLSRGSSRRRRRPFMEWIGRDGNGFIRLSPLAKYD